MKLQLDVPTTWTVETRAEGWRRYVVPGSASATADVVVLVQESLPLPLELATWPQTALAQLNTTLLAALPGGLAGPTGTRRRVQVQSASAVTTTSGWPATLVQATLVDDQDQPVAVCTAALYRFLSYAAEVIIVATDRARLTTLRESLYAVLTNAKALWPTGEPPSLHHMLHDEPTTP